MTRKTTLATRLAAFGLALTTSAAAAFPIQDNGGSPPAPGGVCGLADTVPPAAPKKTKQPGAGPAGSPAPAAAPGAAGLLGAATPTLLSGLGPDLTHWTYWWVFNREPFYGVIRRLSEGEAHRGDDFFLGRGQAAVAKNATRPTAALVRDQVAPALLHVLETERSNDLITGSLIALAKIGDDRSPRSLRPVLVTFLRNGEQRISETATLALGILGDEGATPILISLMRDEPSGRRLIGGKRVPLRTRTFAAYGLGLIGHRTTANDLRREIASELVAVLELGRQAQPDLQVGALAALGVVPLDWEAPAAAGPAAGEIEIAHDRVSLLRYLVKRMDSDTRGDRGFSDDRVRAHVPTAAARLCVDLGPAASPEIEAARGEVVEALLGLVAKHSRERDVAVVQSATIALGVIGNAATGPEPIGQQNERIFHELRRMAQYSASGQSEFFALVALAQIGCRRGPGPESYGLQERVQAELIKALARGKGQKKPWAAIALGVFGSAVRERTGAVDLAVLEAVREAAREGNRPREAGAYAIALGLLQDLESEELLLERLAYFRQDETRGHIAVGLGLMRARGASDEIVEILEASQYRPELCEQMAVGVGLLGDRSAVRRLIGMLRRAKGYSAQAAVALALGRIGDAQSVPPLLEMLQNEQITDSARGYAAVALGLACDKDDLPWNSVLATNVNYRADVSTLTNQLGTGILDLL